MQTRGTLHLAVTLQFPAIALKNLSSRNCTMSRYLLPLQKQENCAGGMLVCKQPMARVGGKLWPSLFIFLVCFVFISRVYFMPITCSGQKCGSRVHSPEMNISNPLIPGVVIGMNCVNYLATPNKFSTSYVIPPTCDLSIFYFFIFLKTSGNFITTAAKR